MSIDLATGFLSKLVIKWEQISGVFANRNVQANENEYGVRHYQFGMYF